MSKRNKKRFALPGSKLATAARSHSPRSAWTPVLTGAKAKVLQYALQHGTTAQTILAPGEDAQLKLLRRLADSLLDIHQPADDAEFLILEEMVAAKWRIRRSWSTESALMECEVARQRAKAAAEFEDTDPPSASRSGGRTHACCGRITYPLKSGYGSPGQP